MEVLIDDLLTSDHDQSETLRELSVLLREDINRESPVIRSQFEKILAKFNTIVIQNLSSEELLNFIKVLVNFVAYDDINRSIVISSKVDILEILQIILVGNTSDSIKNLVILFLNNLITDNNCEKVSKLFYPLFEYLLTSEFNASHFINASQFIKDCIKPTVELLMLEKYVARVQLLIRTDLWLDEDEDQPILICTELISLISKQNDAFKYHGTHIQELISKLLQNIGELECEDTQILRNLQRFLFDSMGEISADDKNSNRQELDFNLLVIRSHDQNPYVLASSLITIGNSINSKLDKEFFYNIVEEDFYIKSLQNFANVTNEDPVTLQGLHFFNQLFDTNSVNLICSDFTIQFFDKFFTHELLTYYQQIPLIMAKFITKIVSSITDLVILDKLLNGDEYEIFAHIVKILHSIDINPSILKIKYLLENTISIFISKICTNHIQVSVLENFQELVDILLDELRGTSEIPFDYIFEKLKTIGVLLSCSEYLKFVKFDKLPNILQTIKEMIISTPNEKNSISGLINNLKFTAVKILNIADSENQELTNICQDIVNL